MSWRIKVLVLVLIIVVSVFAGAYVISKMLSLHIPLVNYCPFWNMDKKDNMTLEKVFLDLDLVKFLGFKGIKMWNIEDYESKGWTDEIFEALEQRELKAVLPFRWKGWNNFPYNETETDEFIQWVISLCSRLTNEKSLMWYGIHYPVYSWGNLNKTNETMKLPEYKSELQRIIDTIHFVDSNHEIYMLMEFDPYYLNPPYYLNHIAGFGVEPYSWCTSNIVDYEKIDSWLNYFKSKGKKAYIDEWGVQTQGASPFWLEEHGEIHHGHASNEIMKCRMIENFVRYIHNWDMVWSYFALHDTGESDWGLANSNNTLKESGRKMQEVLTKKWWF